MSQDPKTSGETKKASPEVLELVTNTKAIVERATKKSWEAGMVSYLLVILVGGAAWLVYSDHSTLIEMLATSSATIERFAAVLEEIEEENQIRSEMIKEHNAQMGEIRRDLVSELGNIEQAIKELSYSQRRLEAMNPEDISIEVEDLSRDFSEEGAQ